MTQRKVVAAYQETGTDGRHYPVSVTDDGQHWLYDGSDRTWVRISLPLPPEALGEVAGDNAEIKVGDTVAVPVLVRDVDRDSLRVDISGNSVWLSANTATKVPR